MPGMFVLDQGVPRDAAGMLRDVGYERIHVGEVGIQILLIAGRRSSLAV